MGTLAGLIVGYVVGAGTGPEGYRKLREAWDEIQASDEWKGLVATATGFVQNALARGGAAFTEQVESATSRDGNLREAWSTIAESGALQHLLSSGMELLGGVLEQGKAVLREPPSAGRT
jgi:hypothetical protein